ncbi:MAG: hypothetical protein M3Z30_08235 [Gemmatimonadota bacterium]|nr:hypothetical protein [Gemmatimonadota bacterium]
MSSADRAADHPSEQPSAGTGGGDPRHRQTTFGQDQEHRRRSFAIEDERWTRGRQLRDWLLLGGMILGYLTWAMIIYALEPGIR